MKNTGKYIASILLSVFAMTCHGGDLTNDDAITPPISSFSAVYYVSSAATGNGSGSDWSNALIDLPSSLQRGALYLVADGSYGTHTFQDANSGSTLITIKKADAGYHGTDVGWNTSTMGSAQAVFSAPFTYDDSYYVIDGTYRDAGWRSNYGIKIYNSSGAGMAVQLSAANAGVYTNIFRFVEVQGNGMGSAAVDRGFYAFYQVACTIQYCYLHDFGNCPILTGYCDNWIVEYSLICRDTHTPAVHGAGWADQGSSDIIIRYDIWEDIGGTAVIDCLGRNSAVTEELNWYIYGNVFSYTPGNPYNQIGLSDGVIACLDGGTGGNLSYEGITNEEYAVNWYIYNNSIINIKSGIPGEGITTCVEIGANPPPGVPNNSNVQIYNNFWYASDPAVTTLGACTGCSSAYNRYDGTGYNTSEPNAEVNAAAVPSIFVDYLNKNYQLTKDTLPGDALPAPYNVDMDDILRGSDGVWDKGAYQFTTNGTPADTNTLGAPNPTQLVQNGAFQTGDFSDWTLTGVVAGNTVGVGANYSYSGGYGAQLGASGGLGYLSQNLTTPAGTYLLSFWLDSPDGLTPNEFLVSWAGKVLFDQTDISAIGWTNMQFTVSSTGGSSMLEFGFRDDPTALGLDNISVTPVQVPGFFQIQTGGAGFGVQNGQFGFNITGTSNLVVEVQACTSLANPVWQTISTNTLTGGSSYFSDTQWANYPSRYYRLTSQ